MFAALLGLWAVMLLAGNTPAGRSLRRWLVEKPAARLARISGTQVALAALLLVTGIGAWLALGHEGLGLYGMAMPELTGLLASVEVTSFIDAAITVTLVATSVRWSAVAHRLRGGRARAIRVRRPERRTPSNDDEDPARDLLAA
jgi:hypothetical protein